MLEPLGVAIHAVDLAHLRPAHTVAVLGAGPIGLLIAAVAKASGAGEIYMTEPLAYRREFALDYVADAVLNPDDTDVVAGIMRLTGGRGVDVCVELSGSVPGTRLAFDLIRVGGRISLVGLTGAPVSLNTSDDIIYKEATVIGTTGRLMWDTWWQMDRLLASGRFDPREVITHRFGLEDHAEAFELAHSGKAGKIILKP